MGKRSTQANQCFQFPLIIIVCLVIALLSITELKAGNATYLYDELNRLIGVTYDDGTEITYTYDQGGNRLIKEVRRVQLPDISIDPTSISFGNVNVGSTSLAQTLTVKNEGTGNLTIHNLSITGANVSEFNPLNNQCSGQSLVPLGICIVQVIFSPTSAGTKSANLTIPSNDPDESPLNVSLAGTGIELLNYRISGGGYYSPEAPTYWAIFSMNVTGPSSLSGWLRYYYLTKRMNFVSTQIISVSVSGNTATISGNGTVNGVAGYTFRATVINATPDIFGITIGKPDGSPYYSAWPKAISGGDLTISQQ